MKKGFDLIDLHKGEADKKEVMLDVIGDISFTGSNLWILACAILIASVGLNVNSTAVVIGAMLISPLMGPIVGAGFALGTYDFDLLKKSMINLGIATLVGLLVSSFYFYISPFKETQSEILARTAPNVYDILIAFFGGLAGVVAITRVEKGNPIPGVAIATALMPPLCTAGYGFAIGSYKFFFGAMYLYIINCFFICIATFIIVKYLKYPVSKRIVAENEKRVRRSISFLIFVMIAPSVFFAYRLFQEKKYYQKIDNFVEKEFIDTGCIIVYKKTTFNTTPKKLELAFLTKKFSESEKASLTKKLAAYDLPQTELIIRQDTTNLKNDLLNELRFNDNQLGEKDLLINNLTNEIKSGKYDNAQILAEAKTLFPDVENLSIANHDFYEGTDSARTVTIMLYTSKAPLPEGDEAKLKTWLMQKLKKEHFEIYRRE